MMQQHKHALQPGPLFTRRLPVPVLLGTVALLTLVLMAGWGSAQAAPLSGAPMLQIVSIQGRAVTLQFDGWVRGETVTLSYSEHTNCTPNSPLPGASFQISGDSFTTSYTLPDDILPGTYFLCATGDTDGTRASQQTFTVNSEGSVQPTPGTPGTTPTTSAGGSPTVPPGATSTAGPSSPGNKGTSSNTTNNTLIAIILLCILVLALLAYLIRIWLQGRPASGQPPSGGGARKP
jgi:hypothetical protein